MKLEHVIIVTSNAELSKKQILQQTLSATNLAFGVLSLIITSNLLAFKSISLKQIRLSILLKAVQVNSVNGNHK